MPSALCHNLRVGWHSGSNRDEAYDNLRVQINAAQCTAIPRPIHTLQAREEPSSTPTTAHVSMETATQTATNTTSDDAGVAQATLLQGVQVPAEFIPFIQVANSWPNCTVYFEPSLELPLCLSSWPIMANGPMVWVTLHNLWPEPATLNSGHRVFTIEIAEAMGPTAFTAKEGPVPLGEIVPGHLSPVQQCQLAQLLEQRHDIFSSDD